ncbi:FXYD domain-containing ion transport regulator 5 isoform X2 [Sciurus carolinensis]|uniref:FXYD domain-containing ion transport regulator 5 isoform X2 n=1 Tax=Sciurus carolinensis TaxID=30640 RepID=UPI001FB302C2|nr:FXYD domain-containing ion transport regulator 5 isoform X2 [Sciurus carolinensis]
MSPSGRLRLLTILGLILPSRGQTLEEATSISTVDPTTLGTHVLTQVPDTVHPEVHSTPEARTPPADETTQSQTTILTETQQPTGRDVLLVTDPGTLMSSEEGTTELAGRPSPGKDARTDPLTPGSSGSDEDNPFYYDVTTLRRRGLLVAAVLFITGIIILTSGKCRQLSQLCGNRRRAYSVVSGSSPT